MHPPLHLSSPASSTTTYAATYIQRYIHTLLAATGFSKSSGQAIRLLTEVLERYLLLVGSTAQKHGAHVGRTIATPWDVDRALEDVGTSCSDIRAWLLEDAGEVAGRWVAPTAATTEPELTAEDNAVVRIDYADRAGPSKSVSILDQQKEEESLPGVVELRKHNGNARRSRQSAQRLDYEEVDLPRLRLLEELFEDDEAADETTPSLSDGSSIEDASTPISESSRRTDKMEVDALGETTRDLKGQRWASKWGIVPNYLPALPRTAESNSADKDRFEALDDADYARKAIARVHIGEVKTQAASSGAASDEAVRLQPLKIEEQAEGPKRSVEDVWHRPLPFSSSSLATTQNVDDIPSITANESSPVTIKAQGDPGPPSSMRAFANDYPVLVNEARASGPAFLTPSGSAFSRVADRRRNLASMLADPSKYVPCDTVFGSVSVRPTAMPFQPTASLLVTPPTSTESAPTFTPIWPHGRAMPCSTTFNSALYPACRHRNASNVLNAARVLGGGPNSATFRRTTRILDPEPILDEQHAERVFHGQPAPRDQLSEGHSILKAAIDMLNAERQEGADAGAPNGRGAKATRKRGFEDDDDEYDEDEEDDEEDDDEYREYGSRKNRTSSKSARQRNLSASSAAAAAAAHRDRIKVKQGTLVATWDWMVRDHTDAQLPAKKFRAGTAGVALGGNDASAPNTSGTAAAPPVPLDGADKETARDDIVMPAAEVGPGPYGVRARQSSRRQSLSTQ